MSAPITVGAVGSPVPRLATAVVIGVGDPRRRDDGVGAAVVDLLSGRGLDATTVASAGECSALTELLTDRALAFLVDTVHAEPSHPGRVHRFVVLRPAYAHVCAAGRRGSDISRAMELLRQSARQPHRMVVFAVEAADTGPGTGLSAPVAAAARRVADEIAAEIPARPGPLWRHR
jgi:hydrogenase maturation protease